MNPIVLAGLILVVGWTWIFRRAIDSGTVRRAAGQLLEMLLYGDSPRVLGQVLLELGLTCLRLGRQLLGPSLVALLLLLLVVVPLRHFVYWRPVQVGEPFLVVATATSAGSALELDYDSELHMDGAPLFDRQRWTYYWRMVASEAGSHRLGLAPSADDARVRAGSASWTYLSPNQGRISIHYPERELWWNDHLVSWPLALFCSCLLWWVAWAGIQMLLVRSS